MRRAVFPPRLALRAATLLALVVPVAAAAQKGPREFTRQGLLIPTFTLAPGVEARAGDDAADEARKAARKALDGKEVEVVDAHRIDSLLVRAGYTASSRLAESEVHILGTAVRADEYLLGRVERSHRQGGPARVSGTLVLMRDQRLRQPLPTFTAPKLDDAAAELGRAAAAARVQFVHERRCENALRDGSARRAAEAARAGIAAYPRAVVARVCLVWALKGGGAGAAEVLAVAREIIELDSANAHGLEAAAVALDSLRRPVESAPLWVRLARADTADLVVAERALYALGDGGTALAESLVVTVRRERPDHLPFVRHQWRIGFDRRNWPLTIAAGEELMRRDSTAVADSLFARRLATAHRSAGRPLEAVATLARGVARFPSDARLYALYAQLVREEADTVLPRGLARFPKHGELLALQSRELRARGKVAEAADAIRLAIAADSTIPDGPLLVAQAEFDLGRPDSALVALRRAVGAGSASGDSTRIAQFAFARGNALYRAAHGTKRAADFALGLRFIAFADSVRPSAQSRFLLGLAALGVAQAGFTEAAANKDRALGCAGAREASTMLPLARSSLEAVREVAAETVEQSLGYVAQLEPYAVSALKGLCGEKEGG